MDVRKLLKYCGKCGEFVCKKSFHSDLAHILVCRSNVILFIIAVLYVQEVLLYVQEALFRFYSKCTT